MPAEFTGASTWEKFEPEAIAPFARWVQQHSGGIVLDIGSSMGIYSAVALFTNRQVEVVAFDPDLASLAAARRLCRHAEGRRLRTVYGFVTDAPTHINSLESAVAITETSLARAAPSGDVGTTRYLCIADNPGNVPSRRLDDLFDETDIARPMLIKCDVEGAELLVLFGAIKLLRRNRPVLLLSVHTETLPTYGHSKESLKTFLGKLGYRFCCLSVDHEEHWWCEFVNA
jgi:FkbM family methyltransferase